LTRARRPTNLNLPAALPTITPKEIPQCLQQSSSSVESSGTFQLGDKTVYRLGYGAMQITGKGRVGAAGRSRRGDSGAEAHRRTRVNLIDTADSYGPYVSEELIREALPPVS